MSEISELKELMKKYNNDLLEVLRHQSAAINVLQGKVHNLECTMLAVTGMLVEATPAHISNPAKMMAKDLIKYSRINQIKRSIPLILISEK